LADESSWQRSTVQTLIRRLVEKEVLLLEERGDKGTYYYNPTVTEEEFTSSRTVEFLKKIFGGNPKMLVSTMLNNNIMSDDDINDIKNHWQERKGNK
jgi:BlaI family penicillinase repressor